VRSTLIDRASDAAVTLLFEAIDAFELLPCLTCLLLFPSGILLIRGSGVSDLYDTTSRTVYTHLPLARPFIHWLLRPFIASIRAIRCGVLGRGAAPKRGINAL